jgi:hypothetical protein
MMWSGKKIEKDDEINARDDTEEERYSLSSAQGTHGNVTLTYIMVEMLGTY